MTVLCGTAIVIDDDPRFRAFACATLERSGFRTVGFASGIGAVEAVREHDAHVVVLDVDLPGVNGYVVCRELRDEFGDELAIVFVTADRTDSIDRTAGLLIGADDYLIKPVDPNEFGARARRLVARLRATVGNGSPQRLHSLTPREQEILLLLARGSRAEAIAEQLVISPRTVATHIQRILAKLGVHSQAEAVALAYREQLVDDDAPTDALDVPSPGIER